MARKTIYWSPQIGPQTEAFLCPADEVMAGGERGGGKSSLIVGREVSGAQEHGHAWNGIIFRKKYKDFKELRIEFDRLIHVKGLPATRVGGENQVNFIKYRDGGSTTLAQAGSISAVEDWQGNQFTHVSIEEAQQFPYLTAMMSILKGSMRSPFGIRPRMLLTGNPGGPGASQIKNMFIPLHYGGDVDIDEGRVNWVEIEQSDGSVAKISRVFIQLPLTENRILLAGDPTYINRLKSIQNEALRAAWLDGRWDVFVGQAFNFSKANILEKPIWPIPKHAPIYMTFDWGFGAPFSVGWWWVDNDGRIYRFREWYGCQKAMPNLGLRITDPEIAEGMLEREKTWGILGHVNRRLAGRDCFRLKPNYKGGGQGMATADEFSEYCKRRDVQDRYGKDVELDLRPGDDTRETKIRQFRNRLVPPMPGELPMLMVYPECKDFIRTVPSLVNDEINPEDIEEHQEDHPYDDAAHICQDRPIGVTDQQIESMLSENKKRSRYEKLDTADRAALEEWETTLEQIELEPDVPSWLW